MRSVGGWVGTVAEHWGHVAAGRGRGSPIIGPLHLISDMWMMVGCTAMTHPPRPTCAKRWMAGAGSAPLDRMKMMGAAGEESAWRSASAEGGLSVNLGPRCDDTNLHVCARGRGYWWNRAEGGSRQGDGSSTHVWVGACAWAGADQLPRSRQQLLAGRSWQGITDPDRTTSPPGTRCAWHASCLMRACCTAWSSLMTHRPHGAAAGRRRRTSARRPAACPRTTPLSAARPVSNEPAATRPSKQQRANALALTGRKACSCSVDWWWMAYLCRV